MSRTKSNKGPNERGSPVVPVQELAQRSRSRLCSIHPDEELRHHANMRITLDLDDGVKVNYGKFGDLLEGVKVVTGGAGDD